MSDIRESLKKEVKDGFHKLDSLPFITTHPINNFDAAVDETVDQIIALLPQWVSIEEQLPEPYHAHVGYIVGIGFAIGYRDQYTHWKWDNGLSKDILPAYWMQLEPPENNSE